jgi:inner membrane protein
VDSLTQAVLGGTVTYAILGKRLGRRAALYGAVLGTVPDLDVFIDFGGPIENMTYHRGFSHSFLVQAFIAPLIAWFTVRPATLKDAYFFRVCLAVFLCFATHSLADLFTVYGTQVLWPFTSYPFSHSILFIVDPTYTLPLLIGFISALVFKNSARLLSLNAWMLCISSLYLVWSTTAKVLIDETVQEALQNRGINAEIYESTPAPLNTLLWRAVAIDGDNYYEIWASLFDEENEIQIQRYPRNLGLIEGVATHPSVERLKWFTKGQYKAFESGNRIYMSDLRMGIEGAYVFNFEVAKRDTAGLVLGSFEQLRVRPQFDRLSRVWQRIWNPTVLVVD